MVVDGYQILSAYRGKKFTTLRCQILSEGIRKGFQARLFPGNRILTIKSVKNSSDGTHLEIKGVPRAAFVSNSVILDVNWPLVESREGLFYGKNPIRGSVDIIRGGVFPDYNRNGKNGPVKIETIGSYSLIRFSAPYPMVPGMEIEAAGAEKLGKMILILPGPINTVERKRIKKNSGLGNQPDAPDAVIEKNLLLRGYAAVPPPLKERVGKKGTLLGSWMLSGELRKKLEKKILGLILQPGGADSRSLKLHPLPGNLLEELVLSMEKDGTLVNKNGWLFPPGSPRLAPFHSSWLSRVRESGKDGIRISSVETDADRDALEELGRTGVICGGSDFWLSKDAAETLCSELLADFSTGDKFTMAEARRILGGNRARTLEILSILELNGKCRRNEFDGSREVM